MTTLDYLMSIVASMKAQIAGMASHRWATVTSSAPLRIQFDGDSQPLATTPVNLVGTLPVGARVWVVTVNRRAVIIGASGGPEYPAPVGLPPTGVLLPYTGATAPAGWLLCDGRSYKKVDYPALARVLGFTGAGDSFTVPDMRGRVPVGLNTGRTGLTVLGVVGGEYEHTLTVNEMPSHTHGQQVTNPISSGGANGRCDYNSDSSSLGGYPQGVTTAASGGGKAHNNMPPYRVVNYIIRT